MSELHNGFVNSLGAADSYIHALELMVTSVFRGEGKDYCAFLLVLEKLQVEINVAHRLVDDLEGER